jgi:hypothetical protein
VSVGIGLILKIGPGVPLTAPRWLLDALQSVEVTSKTSCASGFKLVFSVDTGKRWETLLAAIGGVSVPLVRVMISVTLNGTIERIMDGVVTTQHFDVDKQGGTTLTVIGEDLTRLMDYREVNGLPFKAMPAELQVAMLLTKYAVFGVTPIIIPSVKLLVSVPAFRHDSQHGSDLEHIRALADKVGYVFYLCYSLPFKLGGPGSYAYWGPSIKIGKPQPALALDAGAATNVEDLSFSFDDDRKQMPVLMIQQPRWKRGIPITVGSITPLSPPLGLIPPIPKLRKKDRTAAKRSPAAAALIAMAKAAVSADALKVEGSLDVVRYGQVLKPHRLVGVRGAGLAYDGLYYVDSVTHAIKSGEYKQSFTLTRNARISNVRKVLA